MKKWIVVSVLAIALVAATAFVWSGTVFAQAPNPNTNGYGMMGGFRHGYEMMGGGYGMMGNWNDASMHEYMVDALAQALYLTPEEIDERIQAGEAPWQIAQAEGLSDEQIQQVMQDAHDQALEQAVEAGILSAEEADWMDQHMESMWSGNFGGFGGCHGANGWNNNPNNSNGSISGSRFAPMMGGYQG